MRHNHSLKDCTSVFNENNSGDPKMLQNVLCNFTDSQVLIKVLLLELGNLYMSGLL